MRKQEFVILMLEVLLFTGVLAKATVELENLNIFSNRTIQDGDNYSTVIIYDTLPDQTTVTMTGGNVEDCRLYNTASLNYLGGQIQYLTAHDDSTVEIHSDYDHCFALYDRSKIFLHNGGLDFQILLVSAGVQLHVYGYDLISTAPGASNVVLNGKWKDSQQSFRLTVRYSSDVIPQDSILLHEVPEPSTGLIVMVLAYLAKLRQKEHGTA